MLFNSLTFFCFFAIVLLLHHLSISWRAKKLNLLVLSYAFYAWWNPPFVLLLWLSTATDWFAAKKIHSSEGSRRRRWLWASVAVNLGVLGYFKYADFALETFARIASALGASYQVEPLGIILPVGISFYTFQSMSYSIDIYRGRAKPHDDVLDFALYVTFFPQLVAGPIVRSNEFLDQCRTERRAGADHLAWGATLITLGMFQKVVLADAILAPVANRVFDRIADATTLDAWVGVLAFSSQIFLDFSGYSTIAIGVAMCLGFRLPDNFRSPYAASGFSDFWRRWHISLSTWLRDYLYIGLGGNRIGSARTIVNLMITMLLGGLWHGASWNFVVWGGLHGTYLAVERFLGERVVGRAYWSAVTFLGVLITWVFFRAQTLPDAYRYLVRMAALETSDTSIANGIEVALVVLVTAGLLATHRWLKHETLEAKVSRAPVWVGPAMVSVLLLIILLVPGGDRAFVYFRF